MAGLWDKLIQGINGLLALAKPSSQTKVNKEINLSEDEDTATTVVYRLAKPHPQAQLPLRELAVIDGPQCDTIFPLWGETVLIGRSEANHVVLYDENISRLHAKITFAGGKDSLEDLGSLNGTRVNGDLVRGRRQLKTGDKITLGSAVLEYRG